MPGSGLDSPQTGTGSKGSPARSQQAVDGYCGSSSRSSHSVEATDILTPLPSSSNKRSSQFRSKTVQLPKAPPSPQPLGISELLASPTIDYEFDYHDTRRRSNDRASYFDLPIRNDSYPPLSPLLNSEASTRSSPPPGTPESVSSSTRSSSSRPRIRNQDSTLAPHGTFTSAIRKQSLLVEENLPVFSAPTIPNFTEEELSKLVAAARSGDQLARHRLAGDSIPRLKQRHSLGKAENVWGSEWDTMSSVSRSSRSSSHGSNAGSGRDALLDDHAESSRPRGVRRNTLEPDLFDDVARMTLQSNARKNVHKSGSRATPTV
jgi:hypothetical protein